MIYADLHIHSRYSRATSADCNLTALAEWGRRKGLAVIGTGDFTHPVWRKEIRDTLIPAEPGLYRLNDAVEGALQERLPPLCRGPIRFVLQVEISTIYKKANRTRKVHHVILVPDLDAAERVVVSLSRIGNLESDGRPILGLDSRDLLELVLEMGNDTLLIPAHIWTPWFSALGAQSGFDSITECYGDLAEHIVAVETGLSSDPPMNWRVSALDRYRLISCSDAHSPTRLGREATVFDIPLDYFALLGALRTGRGYVGTVELFPEEGKYHLDGHRKCGVRLEPSETHQLNGRCPQCGKPVTVGVLNRVERLADRPAGAVPPGAGRFWSFVPLAEVLSEIMRCGPDSRMVRAAYDTLVARMGPELSILADVPLQEIERGGVPLLAKAIRRMRAGDVIRQAGYDGEYGAIRVLRPEERQAERGLSLFVAENADAASTEARTPWRKSKPTAFRNLPPPEAGAVGAGDTGLAERPGVRESAPAFTAGVGGCGSVILSRLDPEQRMAAETLDGPLIILAGPGTGKTRTLTHRIAHLIASGKAFPEECLTVTFTRRAAGEMRERLGQLLPSAAGRIPVFTFHALGYEMIRENAVRLGRDTVPRIASEGERRAWFMEALGVSEAQARRWLEALVGRRKAPADQELAVVLARYQQRKRDTGFLDYDDLIRLPCAWLSSDDTLRIHYQRRFRWVSVDEFQDIDTDQYALLRVLLPTHGNVCVIGDPDQSIYGFRGGNPRFFDRFREDFPSARTVCLTRNYRSGRAIVEASVGVIAAGDSRKGGRLTAHSEDATRLVVREVPTDKTEAEFVVRTVEQLIGGSGFFSMDSGRSEADQREAIGFSDIAVLYRTDAQADVLVAAFRRSAMPFQRWSHIALADVPAVRRVLERLQQANATLATERIWNDVEAGLSATERREVEPWLPALRERARRHATVGEFLAYMALDCDVDLWNPRAQAVSLLTLHAAKGLEFDVVFIVGCEDGIVPLRWGGEDDAAIEEERRLFFVGMTRARRRLYLTHARRRLWRGAIRAMRPSPFLANIRPELAERSTTTLAGKRREPRGEQLGLF